MVSRPPAPELESLEEHIQNMIRFVSLQSDVYIIVLGQGLGWSGNYSVILPFARPISASDVGKRPSGGEACEGAGCWNRRPDLFFEMQEPRFPHSYVGIFRDPLLGALY